MILLISWKRLENVISHKNELNELSKKLKTILTIKTPERCQWRLQKN